MILKFVIVVAMVILSFGYAYSYLALNIYGGKLLSGGEGVGKRVIGEGLRRRRCGEEVIGEGLGRRRCGEEGDRGGAREEVWGRG